MTRRGIILCTVASVYDPLGCVSPFILLGKQILQQMCKQNSDWDTPISEELGTKWERWLASLPKIATLNISRCIVPQDFGPIIKREMHHFSDASVAGYGQCSYSRVVNNDGDVHCSLVFSKARVTPSKVITIPRLELNAAVVAVKIGNVLKNEMREDYDHHFWTDSQIVLRYISNDAIRGSRSMWPITFSTSDSTTSNQWHYIQSRDNPADHAPGFCYSVHGRSQVIKLVKRAIIPLETPVTRWHVWSWHQPQRRSWTQAGEGHRSYRGKCYSRQDGKVFWLESSCNSHFSADPFHSSEKETEPCRYDWRSSWDQKLHSSISSEGTLCQWDRATWEGSTKWIEQEQ